MSAQDLSRLLRAMHRGVLPSPLTRSALIATGFGDLEEHLGPLLGLDRVAVQRVIAAVLAERGAVERLLAKGARPAEN